MGGGAVIAYFTPLDVVRISGEADAGRTSRADAVAAALAATMEETASERKALLCLGGESGTKAEAEKPVRVTTAIGSSAQVFMILDRCGSVGSGLVSEGWVGVIEAWYRVGKRRGTLVGIIERHVDSIGCQVSFDIRRHHPSESEHVLVALDVR